MANLQRDYLSPAGNNTPSTYASLSLLLRKQRLSKEDIYDRGIAWSDAPPRFYLAPVLLAQVERVATELQVFLEKASDLVEGRKSHFVIDPEESCSQLLRGSNDLFQLEAAWEILDARLGLGHKFFMKYIEEFKDKAAAPTSPASTVSNLHVELKTFATADERLRAMVQSFPHHSQRISAEDRRVLGHSGNWSQVVSVPTEVQTAFPRRSAEQKPFVVHYDASGSKIQAIASAHTEPGNRDDSNVTRRSAQGEERDRPRVSFAPQDARVLEELERKDRELRRRESELEEREVNLRAMQSAVEGSSDLHTNSGANVPEEDPNVTMNTSAGMNAPVDLPTEFSFLGDPNLTFKTPQGFFDGFEHVPVPRSTNLADTPGTPHAPADIFDFRATAFGANTSIFQDALNHGQSSNRRPRQSGPGLQNVRMGAPAAAPAGSPGGDDDEPDNRDPLLKEEVEAGDSEAAEVGAAADQAGVTEECRDLQDLQDLQALRGPQEVAEMEALREEEEMGVILTR
ncbi:hypothetical protein C8R47DRAFT_1226334 [Mycena vitilis]|nr:hypothetical protein C8R47DRAFT_1226334 [Mycena vitilis]